MSNLVYFRGWLYKILRELKEDGKTIWVRYYNLWKYSLHGKISIMHEEHRLLKEIIKIKNQYKRLWCFSYTI